MQLCTISGYLLECDLLACKFPMKRWPLKQQQAFWVSYHLLIPIRLLKLCNVSKKMINIFCLTQLNTLWSRSAEDEFKISQQSNQTYFTIRTRKYHIYKVIICAPLYVVCESLISLVQTVDIFTV